jgi:hypothetical protein
LWEFPDEVIQWLLIESYFFHNAIPDEARPYLEAYGFLQAGRERQNEQSAPSLDLTGDSALSGESLDPLISSPDSPAVATTVSASSAATTPITSTTSS